MRRANSSGVIKSVVILFTIFIATALLVSFAGNHEDSNKEIAISKQERSTSSRLQSSVVLKTNIRYRVEDVPNVQLQDASRYTSDPNNLIAQRYRIAIDSIAATIRDTFDVEVAVVVLPNFDDNEYATLREFANQLFNTWGIGKKETDQGLLILLNLEEGNREITFETGYGLEAILPDGICKLIQTKIMLPYLTEDKYGEALEAGLIAVQKRLADPDNEEFLGTTMSGGDDGDAIFGFAIWTLFGLAFLGYAHYKRRKDVKKGKNVYQKLINYRGIKPANLIAYFIFVPYIIIPYLLFINIPWRRRLRRGLICEACESIGKMKLEKGSELISLEPTTEENIYMRTRRHTFTCKKCGSQHFEDLTYRFRKYPSYVGSSGSSSSSYDDSSSWGSSSSSSSSGGSWGGGSSGGGGASTRF
ncbi:MAG: TPM domain-containing protein [Lentimicrobiaceae bacterium]|nr:TPM domain-containing protein [Lentimicrobiaceae bacterium]